MTLIQLLMAFDVQPNSLRIRNEIFSLCINATNRFQMSLETYRSVIFPIDNQS